MGKIGTLTRRTFLIGSVAVAGGVAFGAYQYRRPIDNPLLDDLGEGEAALTPYVKVSLEGITLITPRADLGQGAYSVQANLIAEELDIDPATASVTPGMPDAAYYNEAILTEGLPFAAYEDGRLAEAMRSFLAVPAKFIAMQVTGGSSTVPDGFVRLRMAGAVARETLKEAAAKRTGFARAELATADGQVILPDRSSIAYTDLAADAARLEPVTDIELRPSSQWRRLGKPMARIDMQAKCTGQQKYGIDLAFDGMVHAAVRANPGIGGEVESYDDSAAKNLNGVQQILPVKHGVAVVANNTWRAWRAVNAIDIRWGPGPYPATSDEIFASIESVIDAEQHLDHQKRDDGDVDAALASGEVIEASYKVPYLAHAPMEPMNATVLVEDRRCDIWTGTQIPQFVRQHAADITGIDVDDVYVHVQPSGGSFGHRLEDTHVRQAVEIALAMKGTPVKLTWSREEDMTHDYPRPGAIARARGTVANAQVETFDLSVAQSAMAPGWFRRLTGHAIPGPDQTLSTGSWDQPFAIPNYRVSAYRAPDMVPVSSWRSVGASGNGFFHDTFLDELIHAAGADPLAERIRLCVDEESKQVLQAVGELSNWNAALVEENRGRGVAFCLSFGVPTAVVTEVTATDRGIKIDKVFAVVEVGEVLDPVNLEAQVFGGVLFGMAHAMNCETTYDNFAARQNNYHRYSGIRLNQVPEFKVLALKNGARIRGAGEPGVPPAAPSLGNAIFAATSQRLREMPFNKHINFV